MARGVSTVLDVAICLLLVGAALATLGTAPNAGTDEGPSADRTAHTIATATTGITVNQDTRHATLATHLGRATVIAATLDSRPLTGTSYPGAVRNATAAEIPHRAFVTARWTPYPNASLTGGLSAGRDPPPSADVAATTLTVENGIEPLPVEEDPTFASVAHAIATAVVEWLFPPRRTRPALQDPRRDTAVRNRYRTVAGSLGAGVELAVDGRNVTGANDALTTALANRVERGLRAEYDRPAAAVEGVDIDTTTVVVRRWERGE